MNILHISNFGKTGFSGIREVVEATTKSQISLGHKVRVCLIEPCEDYDTDPYYHIKNINHFKKLIANFNPDIVIFHGLFYVAFIRIYKYLLTQNIPYIIKLHGAASFENITKNHLKKIIAVKLIFGRFIKNAKVLSFLNIEEKNNFSLIKYNSDYIIEPNGISTIIQKENYDLREKIIFSFIGRIAYQHKGLDILLKAFKIINDSKQKKEFEFHFYGPLYDNTFKNDILPYCDFVKWHSPVMGDEKEKVYRQTDVFILTSRFEGMPMGILEALSHGVPCMITPQTNMSDLILTSHSGWVTELDANKIVECIEKIVKSIRINYRELSKNANESVRNYLWDEIVKRSIIKYEQLVNFPSHVNLQHPTSQKETL